MQKTTVFCDKCSKEITNEKSTLKTEVDWEHEPVKTHMYISLSFERMHNTVYYDLCRNCKIYLIKEFIR